jgi:replicative DNA helicase
MIYDNQYEQLAIGSMLNNEGALLGTSELDAECFFDINFRTAFNAVKFLVDANAEVNLYAVNNSIKSSGAVFSLEDLISLDDKFYIPEKFSAIITYLKERKQKRGAITTLSETISSLEKSNKPYSEVIQNVGDVYEISQKRSDDHVTSSNYIEEREKIDNEKKERIPILTGMTEVDDILTYKLGTKEISIIAARPSNGKSAVKANIIRNLSNQGIGTVNYILEQSLEVETDRLEAIESGIPLATVANSHKWSTNDPKWDMLKSARSKIAEWNMHMINGFGKSFQKMRSELRYLRDSGIKIAFWDLFDRMEDINQATMYKAQSASRILQQVLATAHELDIHCCLLVQMNRETAKKKDPKPSLHELKDSGAYEETARTVFLLHWPPHYDEALVSEDLEIKIAKQSNGPTKKVNVTMSKENLLISDQTSIKGLKPSDGE